MDFSREGRPISPSGVMGQPEKKEGGRKIDFCGEMGQSARRPLGRRERWAGPEKEGAGL